MWVKMSELKIVLYKQINYFFYFKGFLKFGLSSPYNGFHYTLKGK